MAINLTKGEAVSTDTILVDMLLSNLPHPAKGEKTLVDVGVSFDANDPADAKWIAALAKLDQSIADAQSGHADAADVDDKSLMASFDRTIRELSIARESLFNSYFGYYKRENGKATVLKGSLVDRIVNAVNDINRRDLNGDSVTVRKINYEARTLQVVRETKAKRTRVLRPQMTAIAENLFSRIDAMTDAESVTE